MKVIQCEWTVLQVCIHVYTCMSFVIYASYYQQVLHVCAVHVYAPSTAVTLYLNLGGE